MNNQTDSYKPLNRNSKHYIQPSHQQSTPGTLLLPCNYLIDFEKRMSELGIRSISKYLQFLLKKYQVSIFNYGFPRSNKTKTQYQDLGRNLLRINIRASNTDWIVLSELSHGLGFSRCYVFVILFELDTGIRSDIDRVPTPRLNRDGKVIQYAITVTNIILPEGDIYIKKCKLNELSRLRDPVIRDYSEYFNTDGSLKRYWSKY